MYYIGIDAGSQFCKILVLDHELKISFRQNIPFVGDPEGLIIDRIKYLRKKVLKTSVKELSISISGRNGETYEAKKNTHYFSEFQCLAKAAYTYDPEIRTVIDSGSFTNKVLKIDNGKILDYKINDICSSGSGIFLKLVSKSLDITLDQMTELALSSQKSIPITSQCSIFAESEVIYLMNEGHKLVDIAKGVCDSIVGRIIPQIQKISPEPDILFTGGVSKNTAIINGLEKALNTQVQLVNDDIGREYFVAYGAALLGGKES